ncbi:MAG TPA: maleylpyruvate isomerase family mycothiol-dependent enzyme [Acidimicrobiales bacterium]|nr:maleylpyruvate isomerase family mycothiol-dependent enzyme [Acidimicrobiales bacterium]
MARVDVDAHVEALRDAGLRLADAAGAAGPDAPVPACPDWVVRDLVRHQGGVHRWATGIVADRRAEPWNVELEDVAGSWPSDRSLIDWFLEGHAALLRALGDAPDDLVCWSFLPAPSPRAFWARRQAHETSIHRVDAEQAARRRSKSCSAEFAADGVDELLTGFVAGGRRLKAEDPSTLEVRCDDTSGAWMLLIEPAGVTVREAHDDPGADCTLSGPANDLYLALWNRRSAEGLRIEGDRAVFALFADSVRIRWV